MDRRIIFKNPNGGVSIIMPTPEAIEQVGIDEIAAKDVPAGVPYRIVDVTDIPSDRTFRDAWDENLTVNVPKAKDIAHEKRRAARTAEFVPLDIAATIPAQAQQAEAVRQAVRDKYATIQIEIDAAQTADEIKVAMGMLP